MFGWKKIFRHWKIFAAHSNLDGNEAEANKPLKLERIPRFLLFNSAFQ